MRVRDKNSQKISASTLFEQLFAIAVTSLLIIMLPALGSSPDVQPIGDLAREVTGYLTSVVALYDVRVTNITYLMFLASIGLIAGFFAFGRPNTRIELQKDHPLAIIKLILFVLPVICYVSIAYVKQSANMATWVENIFISLCLAVCFCALQHSKRVGQSVSCWPTELILGGLALVLMLPFFLYFGKVPVMEPSTFIFNIDVHMSNLIAPAFRLLDGYRWMDGVEPAYGFLMPSLSSVLFSSEILLGNFILYLQFLEVIAVLLFASAIYLRSKSFINLVLILPVLYFFYPGSMHVLVPNHSAWRYLGVAVVFFLLSLPCVKGGRLSPILKGIVGAGAFLINFETGLVLVFGLIGSEVLAKKLPVRRTFIVLISVIISVLVVISFVTGEALSVVLPYLTRVLSANSAAGGEPYYVIPVFAVVVLHCSVVIWRLAKSKLRTPQQDFDFLAAAYCLGWAPYFINRPSSVYLLVIFLVYSFLLLRLRQDLNWLIKGLGPVPSLGTVFFFMFAYFTFYVDHFQSYSQKMKGNFIAARNINETDAFREINASALELSRTVSESDAYITPFGFFTRGISGIPNNLRVADPFAMLTTEREVRDFLAGPFPEVIFLPRSDRIFHPNKAPEHYEKFIKRIEVALGIQRYQMDRQLEYWKVFRKHSFESELSHDGSNRLLAKQ